MATAPTPACAHVTTRAGAEVVRLHGDAEVAGVRVAGDDRVGHDDAPVGASVRMNAPNISADWSAKFSSSFMMTSAKPGTVRWGGR